MCERITKDNKVPRKINVFKNLPFVPNFEEGNPNNGHHDMCKKTMFAVSMIESCQTS
jgi:hypothetical protein